MSIENEEFIYYYNENQRLAAELPSPKLTEQGSDIRMTLTQINDLKTDKCYSGDNFDVYMMKVQ